MNDLNLQLLTPTDDANKQAIGEKGVYACSSRKDELLRDTQTKIVVVNDK